MAAPLVVRILTRVVRANEMYHRLVLVVGPARSGKTGALRDLAASRGWPFINVNLRLSERLLDLTQRQRSLRAARLLAEVVEAEPGDVVALDNLELLFSPELALDPLRLLQGISRNRTIVAAWCGGFDGHHLTYAEPGHPEEKHYSRPQVIVVSVEDNRHQGDTPVAGVPLGAEEIP
jgi:hypothetical protein